MRILKTIMMRMVKTIVMMMMKTKMMRIMRKTMMRMNKTTLMMTQVLMKHPLALFMAVKAAMMTIMKIILKKK